ncbi:TIGR03618 family F420-dependent PPOX class oxidoreductase [Micromonospora sp. HUAS LYJ1]|uniref:TIGR03618 family F420-dependent PPOX class oxidoreductase n=1 Tax=Micromonospora sp. HUAS LYJ1 TaxID=3061626 RepID=UPI002672CC8E|nr:TIGR03618 family F420-dependent PPOX class oxidoreductase [Micromonospora sp. HUAS LYJ1]WKU03893.1 TIGR03618 family F420-dependent PPOX class oxidoreductase [Micromonospora sp. HUAS LYJ1]
MAGRHRLDPYDERALTFCRERHLATLTTLRPDGTPHVVPVGLTYDPAAGLARVITSAGAAKARYVAAAGAAGVPVAACHLDGRWWLTIEGRAMLRTDAAAVAEAERRYAERYRPPRPNPERVVIEIGVTRLLGSLPPPASGHHRPARQDR